MYSSTEDHATAIKFFANRVVLVTGGTSGIGFACVEKFTMQNAKVVFVGRSNSCAGLMEPDTKLRDNIR